MKSFITTNSKETQKLGEKLAQEIKNGVVIGLSGELGAGKTTFTQGLLKGLGVEGPYTSPTFLIMKEYTPQPSSLLIKERGIKKVYHFDAYRVGAQDILNLGWEEIVSPPVGGPKNVVIIEWPDKVKKIIPSNAWQIDFEWLDPPRVDKRLSPRVEAGENKRKITIKIPNI